jgi:hypothetical protein
VPLKSSRKAMVVAVVIDIVIVEVGIGRRAVVEVA